MGSIPGGFLGILLIIYFLIIAGFEIRVLAEVALFFLLEGTPIWAVVIPFICWDVIWFLEALIPSRGYTRSYLA